MINCNVFSTILFVSNLNIDLIHWYNVKLILFENNVSICIRNVYDLLQGSFCKELLRTIPKNWTHK
jgi:hypothetical protein